MHFVFLNIFFLKRISLKKKRVFCFVFRDVGSFLGENCQPSKFVILFCLDFLLLLKIGNVKSIGRTNDLKERKLIENNDLLLTRLWFTKTFLNLFEYKICIKNFLVQFNYKMLEKIFVIWFQSSSLNSLIWISLKVFSIALRKRANFYVFKKFSQFVK